MYKYFWLLAIILSATFGCSDQIQPPINKPAQNITFDFTKNSQDPKFKGMSISNRIQLVSSEFARKRPEPTWEVTEWESPKQVKAFEKKFTEYVNNSLNRYADQVEEVQQIVSKFNKLSVGVYNRNENLVKEFKPGKPSAQTNSLNVFVYGAETYKEEQDLSFKYIPELGITLPGVRYSDQHLFDSVLAHESYHGFRFLTDEQVRKSTRQPSTLSPAEQKWFWRFRAREELNAYSVGRKVLNLATNNAYQNALGQVIESNRSPSLAELFDTVTVADLELIDSVLQPSSNHETMSRCYQYLMDLGVLWLERNTPPDNRRTVEEDLYMAFAQNPRT